MKTKIIALLLVLSLIPCVGVGADTSDTLSEAYSDSILSKLCPELDTKSDTGWTRLEFVAAIIKLMGNMDIPGIECGFSDVSEDNENYNELAAARQMGIVSAATLFYPDDYINLEQALAMILRAAGYEEFAKAKGGYPYGYLTLASEHKLLDGIETGTDSYLSSKSTVGLLCNMLDLTIMEGIGFVDGNIIYRETSGNTFLSFYHDIYKSEGIISANEYTGLYHKDENCGEDTITIDFKNYRGSYNEYLGLKVKAYWRDDAKKSLVAVYPVDNIFIALSDYNYPEISSEKLKYTDNGNKYKEENLDGSYSIIYNGKSITPSLFKTLSLNDYSMTLIDNDNDGKIEVIKLDSMEYMVVSGFDSANEIIYDKYKNGSALNLGGSDLVKIITSADGEEIDIDSLKNGNIIGYSMSYDNKLCHVKVFDSYIAGTVTGSSDDGVIYIDDIEYKLSDYYIDNINNFTIGNKCLCYLGANDKIVYMDEISSALMQYAYLVALEQESGLEGKLLLKLFTTDGSFLVAEIGKYITIDGVRKSSKEAYTILSAITDVTGLSDGGAQKKDAQRIIKYMLGEDGRLSRISLPGTLTDLSELSKPRSIYDGALVYSSTTAKQRDGYFYPYFITNSSTVFIKVPYAIADKLDEEKYEIVSPSFFVDGRDYFVSAYDVDGGGYAGLVLHSSDTDGGIGEQTSSAVVERVYDTVDEDGRVCTAANLYMGGSWATYTAEADCRLDVKALQPGDIIRASVIGGNKLSKVKLDYDISQKTLKCTDELKSTFNYIWGTIYSHENSRVLLVPPGNDLAGSLSPSDAVSLGLSASNTVFVKLYKDRSGNVKSAEVLKEQSTDTIKSYMLSGVKADFMVARTRYNIPSFTVIYITE